MGFTQKIDVLELLIEILREHEKEFDSLLDRLEKAVAMAEKQAIQ